MCPSKPTHGFNEMRKDRHVKRECCVLSQRLKSLPRMKCETYECGPLQHETEMVGDQTNRRPLRSHFRPPIGGAGVYGGAQALNTTERAPPAGPRPYYNLFVVNYSLLGPDRCLGGRIVTTHTDHRWDQKNAGEKGG